MDYLTSSAVNLGRWFWLVDLLREWAGKAESLDFDPLRVDMAQALRHSYWAHCGFIKVSAFLVENATTIYSYLNYGENFGDLNPPSLRCVPRVPPVDELLALLLIAGANPSAPATTRSVYST
jgi:hypothetical protein